MVDDQKPLILRDEKGRILPGQKIGGRRAIPDQVKRKLIEATPRAVDRLIELIESKKDAVALRACELIVERVFGRVAVPIVGEDGGAISLDIRAGLLAAVAKLAGPKDPAP